ncbi:MAG: outer membrane beta-barrel protein [Roseiarcus sp.]|jgi:outer membrane immunogenic protein
MRRVAWSLLPFALLLATSGAEAADFNRTNTGPNGADFSGVEIGPDLGVALGSAGSANISGPAGGLHVGYNFQAGRVVGGVEADGMFSSIRSGTLGSASFSQDFLSSARVKGGYAFGDLLAYGTVGWAWSTTNYKDLGASSDVTVKGLAFGAGAEYAITRNVSLRAELLRYDFGSATYATPFSSQSLTTSTNVVRVGASVHF